MNRTYSSFRYLNIAQFLVTLNDSIFRLIVTYCLIDLFGIGATNKIVAISAALFVLPFLLFSMPAGQLADRFSKRRLLIWTLWAEVLFMVLGFFAIWLKEPVTIFLALFLVALQAAIFNPTKFAIIPEIEPEERLSKANGHITLVLYVAIILGTFLASIISELTGRNYPFVIFLSIIFSLIGLVVIHKVQKTEVKNPKQRITLFFLGDLSKSFLIAKKCPNLLLSIYSSSYFLFTAAYTQLNLIPFGIQSLGISDVATGYVFLAAAFGIGVGAIFIGFVSGKEIRLGASVLGSLGTGVSYVLLYLFQYHVVASVLLFFSVGFCGGLYIVPLDAYIQCKSPEKHRGLIAAASTFLSFIAVLLSAGAIVLFGDVFLWSAATGFLYIGLFTIFVSFFLLFKFR